MVGASRLVFAMGRDGILPDRLSHVSAGAPDPDPCWTGAVVAWPSTASCLTWFLLRGDPFTLFVESGVIGTLILLVVYVLAHDRHDPPACLLLRADGDRRWKIVIQAFLGVHRS